MPKASPRSSDFIWKRPNTSSLWFSRAVPKHVQETEKRKVIQFSLGTSDPARAKALARKHAAEQDDRWAGIVASRHLPDDPKLVAHEVGYVAVLERIEAFQRTIPADDHAAHEAELKRREAEGRMVARLFRQGNLTKWEAVAISVLANPERKLDLEPGTIEFDDFVRELARGTVKALEHNTRQERDADIEPMPDRTLREQIGAEGNGRAKPGERLTELFEKWAADRLAKGEKRADTVAQDRKVIAQFADFVGTDRAINSITPVEIAEYRDMLRDLPPKWRSKKVLAGLSLRAAAEKARALELPKTAFTSVNKHLSTISPLYRWLGAQPAWAGLANPVSGLFHDKVRGRNRRPSFSTDQINAILRSPLFAGFLANGKEHLPGNQQADDWRRWIPLICLFTGARVGEIAQLRIGDVRQERGKWFIHIRHDEAAGLTTKSGKSRPAPVHSMLARIGFLNFVQRQIDRAGGDLARPLFTGLDANKRGQISGVPSRFWRDYLEAIGVKNGSDGFGAHSFRHTLADRLRSEAELVDAQVGILLGHAQHSTTAGYGSLSQGTVNMLAGWIEAVRFEGVGFNHLIP